MLLEVVTDWKEAEELEGEPGQWREEKDINFMRRLYTAIDRKRHEKAGWDRASKGSMDHISHLQDLVDLNVDSAELRFQMLSLFNTINGAFYLLHFSYNISLLTSPTFLWLQG